MLRAQAVLSGIATRMEAVGLRLHPEKTRIVYCRDSKPQAWSSVSYEDPAILILDRSQPVWSDIAPRSQRPSDRVAPDDRGVKEM
jgi:hypothetical protein